MLLGALHLILAVQAAQATVTGTVRDEGTGEPLAGAVVALPDLSRATATDAAGRYLIPQVPAGPQHITARFLGHESRTIDALVPSTGRLEIDISLLAQPLRLRAIEVRPPLNLGGAEFTDSTGPPDRSLSIAAVRNDPRLSEPDALESLGGGEVALRPETPSGVHLHGGGSDQTGYLLDGIPVFSPYHSSGTFTAWNPDALAGVRLTSSLPSPADPDALGGSVAAITLPPGAGLRTRASLSTTQARLTLDGPAGLPGVGYLLSFRAGFPGVPSPQHDPTYLRAESGDWLAKVEMPAPGGRLRLLAYESENEIGAAASADGLDRRRNRFAWQSASQGIEWSRGGETSLRVAAWRAGLDAGSTWWGESPADLTSRRLDLGLLLAAERNLGGRTTLAGIRVVRSRTTYEVASDSTTAALAATTPVVTAFVRRSVRLGSRSDLEAGAVLSAGRGLRLGPEARLRVRAAPRLALTGSYARTHQYAQSLRNPESVAGNVFPADLFVGAGAPGIPVARSDLIVIGAEYLPAPGIRMRMETWARGAEGLVLVAPRGGAPFSTGGRTVGSLRAEGLSLDLAGSTARLGVLASYALQGARLVWADSSYVPAHGTTHRVEGGVIVSPTSTTSIRLGAAAEFGRRGTVAVGALEWEACNLRDRGCEFAGSPEAEQGRLGRTELPAYFRLDLGVRKHWHLHLGSRNATLAVFGTVTNLLGSRNILTYTVDPASGERTPLEMRPRAPLVAGLDWQF